MEKVLWQMAGGVIGLFGSLFLVWLALMYSRRVASRARSGSRTTTPTCPPGSHRLWGESLPPSGSPSSESSTASPGTVTGPHRLPGGNEPCPFYRGDGLCIANDPEKAAMAVAARALLGGVNGGRAGAAEVLRHSAEIGVARIDLN